MAKHRSFVSLLLLLLLLSPACWEKPEPQKQEPRRPATTSAKVVLVPSPPEPPTPPPTTPAPVPSAEEVTEKLWKELQSVVWVAPYGEWQKSYPEATCQQYRGDGAYRHADEEWCYRCEQEHQTERAEWSFYAFELAEPLVCRLQQFRARATEIPLGTLEEVHRALAQRLDASYGSGEENPRGVHERGSAYWQRTRRWRTGELEVLLYIRNEPYIETHLGLLARHSNLLDALSKEERLREGNRTHRQKLDRQLGEQLQDAFPALPALLGRDRYEENHAELRTHLLDLLERVQTSPKELQPALLLAADRLAGRLWNGDHDSPEWAEQRERLASYGLSYEWAPLGARWIYTHDLLWRLWQKHSGSAWGEQAFVLLLNRGWDPSPFCAGGSDQFRVVIEQGEKFLAAHPESSRRFDVLFAVAQAYETWFSLSRASEHGEYVESSRYQEGAEAAREKAVADYEQMLRLAPESDEAAYARRRLPRLKLGIDTNQRRFFCIYD